MAQCSVGAWEVTFSSAGLVLSSAQAPAGPPHSLFAHLAPALVESALFALSDLLPTQKGTSCRGHSGRLGAPKDEGRVYDRELGAQRGKKKSRNRGSKLHLLHKIASINSKAPMRLEGVPGVTFSSLM